MEIRTFFTLKGDIIGISQNECIQRSLGISEWFQVDFGGVQKVRNLKSGLKMQSLNFFSVLI